MEKTGKGGGFSVFLENVNQDRKRTRSFRNEDQDAHSLLNFLPEPGNPLEISDLVKKSKLGQLDLLKKLELAVDQRLAVIHGPPGSELVELTPKGKETLKARKN